jgi:hypothetical protein
VAALATRSQSRDTDFSYSPVIGVRAPGAEAPRPHVDGMAAYRAVSGNWMDVPSDLGSTQGGGAA